MKSSRTVFKSALQRCKDNEKVIRNKKLLGDLHKRNHKSFWRGVNEVKRNNTVYPNCIDGKQSPSEICDMFSDKYRKILDKKHLAITEKFC